MKKLSTWYKNMNLSSRVILSMNMAILVSILVISLFATINRIKVQKSDANALVENELRQVTNLLGFLQDRPLGDLENIIRQRVLYNTGFISLISTDGEVKICRVRQGQNISGTPYFNSMRTSRRGEVVYTDPVTEGTNFQYHTYYEPLGLYVTATLEKREFIDKAVFNTLKILLFALIFTWLAFSLVNYFIMKTITNPIDGLVKVVKELGEGSLAEKFHYPHKDEVGQMTFSVNELVEGLQRTAIFAREMGKNNFEHPFEPLSDKDVLGNALLEMRFSLKTASEEEKLRKTEDEKRNWTTQGLARFADILRQNNDSIEELSYDIIRNLVDYLGVNQGGIFILNAEDEHDKFLELTACYAFDRRKYLEKKILPGEGLVGTCFLEQECIYITNIPQDYIKITSGLGDENPSSLLLIPLKVNEKIYGVIELASFSQFEKHKLEFVEKIGESIASTISSVRINTQTALLLEKSQQQAEEMRAQEEEMRQNMEELTATQEAMAEKGQENLHTIDQLTRENQHTIDQVKAKEKEMLDTLEYCPEGVVKYDKSGTILLFNKASENIWGYSSGEVLGKNIKMLMPDSFVQNHDGDLHNYPGTGQKQTMGMGGKLELLRKSGDLHPVFLTIVETRIGEEIFFTGFFSDLSGFESADPDTESPDTTGPQDENAGSDSGKADNSDTSSDASMDKEDLQEGDQDIFQGGATDNQKAWSQHISQKGKGFRKSKKK
ncbi:MAG: PAS domain S-box protein [Bacteroidetes bacterium]|nr:MAG: PAS domain S-box protein [Bacteroidota bacterium]